MCGFQTMYELLEDDELEDELDDEDELLWLLLLVLRACDLKHGFNIWLHTEDRLGVRKRELQCMTSKWVCVRVCVCVRKTRRC
jgi:hypothetical protein